MAIFGTFWPFLLLEPFGLYVSMLHVERMRLIISPIWKNGEGFIAQKSPKNEKKAILSVILAILRLNIL